MEQLRLPTVAVPVTLTLVGGNVLAAELFVADHVRSGRAQLLEDVAATLDDDAAFVPVREGGGVRLLAKRAVAWVGVARVADDVVELADAGSDVVTLYDRQYRVVVELAGGARVEGSLFDSSPAERPRVIDHLNRARRFVRLWTPEQLALIHTDQIVSVSEQE